MRQYTSFERKCRAFIVALYRDRLRWTFKRIGARMGISGARAYEIYRDEWIKKYKDNLQNEPEMFDICQRMISR